MPDEQLPIRMSRAAFQRFVRGGQIVKLGAFLLAAWQLASGHATALDLALCLGMYLLTTLGVTAGFHRMFAHGSYEAHPALRYTLAALGTMSGQGTVLIWVATHRRHHQHSDQPDDPHSPHGPEGSVIARFWHAHVGWILGFFPRDWERYVPDLLRDPVLVAMHQRSMAWVGLGLVIPAVLGGWLSHGWPGALGGMLWGGFARVFLCEQSTCLVNSWAHTLGSRPFATRDQSRNSWPVALLTLGEGWHNNHHAFPASARHGLAWWQLDPTYWAIRSWQALGLASQPIVPDAGQMAAKIRRPEAGVPSFEST